MKISFLSPLKNPLPVINITERGFFVREGLITFYPKSGVPGRGRVEFSRFDWLFFPISQQWAGMVV